MLYGVHANHSHVIKVGPVEEGIYSVYRKGRFPVQTVERIPDPAPNSQFKALGEYNTIPSLDFDVNMEIAYKINLNIAASPFRNLNYQCQVEASL